MAAAAAEAVQRSARFQLSAVVQHRRRTQWFQVLVELQTVHIDATRAGVVLVHGGQWLQRCQLGIRRCNLINLVADCHVTAAVRRRQLTAKVFGTDRHVAATQNHTFFSLTATRILSCQRILQIKFKFYTNCYYNE